MARVALVASVTTGIEFVAEEELRARLAPRGGDAAAALQLARHPGKVSLSLPASELDAMLEVRSLEKLHAVVAYAPELLAASAITAPPSASKAARDSKRRFNKKAANNRKEPRKASDDDATAAPAAAEPNEQQPEPPAAAPSERIPESDIQRANLERLKDMVAAIPLERWRSAVWSWRQLSRTAAATLSTATEQPGTAAASAATTMHTLDEYDDAAAAALLEQPLLFRVTGKISGVTRNVIRENAGRAVAEAIVQRFPHWRPELRAFELELELTVHLQSIWLTINLVPDALWRRYPIKPADGEPRGSATEGAAEATRRSPHTSEHALELGVTSLKSSMAFAMCWLLDVHNTRRFYRATKAASTTAAVPTDDDHDDAAAATNLDDGLELELEEDDTTTVPDAEYAPEQQQVPGGGGGGGSEVQEEVPQQQQPPSRPYTVVLEPMVGSGMVAIELVARFADLVVCGDNAAVAVSKTCANLSQLPYLLPFVYGTHARGNEVFVRNERLGSYVVMQFDARALPLASDSVDGIVTDLPFGKRVGSLLNNNKLYPALLDEFARVLKKGRRCVLLTADPKPLNISLTKRRVWAMSGRHRTNLGGTEAFLYILTKRFSTGDKQNPRLCAPKAPAAAAATSPATTTMIETNEESTTT